jgi:hypothetical protein
MHDNYRRVVGKARDSHQKFRSPEGITDQDITLARLYSYAFRLHTIGAFHATRLAIERQPPVNTVAAAYRQRALEVLEDLGHQTMEPVPHDFRAVVATFHRYHTGIVRVMDSLEREAHESSDGHIAAIAPRFHEIMENITGECGIHVTQDQAAPELASFVVPNLGIIIVPLVYGDHHSWNLAYLAGEHRDVPMHRHHHGVEIHLGYEPTHGLTILGQSRAIVDEGYAMPIPPQTDHGWVNTSDEIHHVPFIFGSLKHGGWGVFLDVEAQTKPVSELNLVERDSREFSQMIYLESQIQRVERMAATFRKTLIPFTVTNRGGSGGLELNLTRINPTGFSFPPESFRIVSVARGRGRVSINGIERDVETHDHFGIPGGMRAHIVQRGTDPLVVLDAQIKGHAR